MHKRKQYIGRSRILQYVLILLFLLYLIEYISLIIFDAVVFSNSTTLDLTIAIGCSLWYFWQYRRYNILCFELLFLPIFILASFYSDIVLSFISYVEGGGIGGAFSNTITNSVVIQKSQLVRMIALLLFLLGCIKGNKQKKNASDRWQFPTKYMHVDYRLMIRVLSILLVLELIMNYINENFSTWFSYEIGLSDEERNRGIGRIEAICLISTIVEFTRLARIGVSTFKKTIVKINKLYLLEIIFVSTLLILSGNRNEMLLICLPAIVAYSVFIKPIPNKVILIGIIVGFAMMVYSGVARQGRAFSSREMNIYSTTKDFSLVQINCDFLIKYTDDGNLHLFETLPASILSGIPYVGPLIVNTLGWDFSSQSTYITTDNLAAWEGTGLGTSLVGDLYYNAKLPFVIIFMYLLGYAVSRSYIRLTAERRYNIWILVFYIYMVSNAIYFVRQQWDFPIHDMLYAIILISVLYYFFRRPQSSFRLT